MSVVEARRQARLVEMAVSIGARVRELRQMRQMSQRELAQRAGMDPGCITRLETASQEFVPTLGTLDRVATGLDVELTTILVAVDWPAQRAAEVAAESERAAAAATRAASNARARDRRRERRKADPAFRALEAQWARTYRQRRRAEGA